MLKDAAFSHNWHDIASFAADPLVPGSSVADVNSRWPLEIHCHDAMSSIPGVDHVARLREPKRRQWINNEDKSYRLYIEWYGRGNLMNYIRRYREQRAGNPHVHLPEPFLWHVAESLAKSGVAMRSGAMPGPPGAPPPPPAAGWQPIVHRVCRRGSPVGRD